MTWRNREPLAVKLALEEWSHWLEGAELPFVVWTAQKMLFVRTFSLSYRPGSCNNKPDALSWLPSVAESTEPAPILPPTCFVAALKWESEAYVTLAQARGLGHPGPGPSG